MNRLFNFSAFYVSSSNLVGHIDYTLLDPSATKDTIIELCGKATKLGVKSVCVLPKMVSVATEALSDSPVLVCTVVSFPHGRNTTEQKLAETKRCINDGADEVDMVLNYQKIIWSNDEELEEKDYDYMDLYDELIIDIEILVEECHRNTNKDNEKVILKVIVESGLLTPDETEHATNICLDAGADFIKTSTGMVSVGAELDKVQIMRNTIASSNYTMKIKASGAIRTLAHLQKFAPYVDRFGVGFGSVDSIFGGTKESESDY